MDPGEAFEHGKVIATPQGDGVLQCEPLDPLVLPSGRLVGCDPLCRSPEKMTTFAYPFAQGRHDVSYAVLELEGGRLPLYVAVGASATRPLNWVEAEIDGPEEVASDKPVTIDFSADGMDFVSESWIGCLMDRDAFDFLRRPDRWAWFVKAVSQGQIEKRYWGAVSVIKVAELNALLFRTGQRPGMFPSYAGLDARGKAACVVTDLCPSRHR